jgi:hypothetical protein
MSACDEIFKLDIMHATLSANAEREEARRSLIKPDEAASAPRIASAYRDDGGWILFDEAGEPIEEWPSDWPKAVDRQFIESQGIEVQ